MVLVGYPPAIKRSSKSSSWLIPIICFLKIITSNVELSGLEVETAGDNKRAFFLKEKLENYLNENKGEFSYVFSSNCRNALRCN